MELVIFNDLTTEEALKKIEAGAEKHTDLYVDMDDAESRKYVKGEASFITDIRKKLEAARISKSSQYRVRVEAEFKLIDDRLIAANLPYSNLINGHKEKRKIKLDAEKAAKEVKLLAAQKESDHEFAIMMDEKIGRDIADENARVEKERLDYEAEVKLKAVQDAKLAVEQLKQDAIDRELKAKADAVLAENNRLQAIEDARIAAERAEQNRILAERRANQDAIDAAESAKQAQIKRQQDEQDRINAETAAREADKSHKRKVNQTILSVLMGDGISEKDGKTMIKLAAQKLLPQLTINY